ncbi:MFS transporter [Roseibium salinum]|nr:MFS transporter [Roseibium salinum]
MLFAALCCLSFVVTNSLFVSSMPLYLVTEINLPEYTPGLSLSVKCFFEVVTIYSAARIALRTGVRTVLIAAACTAFTTMMLFTQVTSIAGVVAVAMLEGTYYGLFAGVAITYVQSFAPDKPGRATAVFMNSLFLGGMLGSISMGLIADSFDYRTVVFVASLISVCAGLLLAIEPMVIRKTRALAEQRS